VSVDATTRTTVVWVESRKVGQYDGRELSVRFVHEDGPPRPWRTRVARQQPRAELLWNSPAAAGHNRQLVMRVPLRTEGDRAASRALEQTLAAVSIN
jgi:hypothetical protein